MQTIRDFVENGDRYKYDFTEMTTQKGWAQVDTGQDAWYYGTWTNPFTLEIFNYCEGDTTLQKAENTIEYRAEIEEIKRWNDESGHGFKGIDPGFNEALKGRFGTLGMAHLLH